MITASYTSSVIEESLRKFTVTRRINRSVVYAAGYKWLDARSPKSTRIALVNCKYKQRTRELLQKHDIPVPRGYQTESNLAVSRFRSLDSPVVVKPFNGQCNTRVFVDIDNISDLTKAVNSASYGSRNPIIIEEFINGTHYRVLVGPSVVSVIECRPCTVIGNGSSSVMDLVNDENNKRKLNFNKYYSLSLSRVSNLLSDRGLTLEYIPSEGEIVQVSTDRAISHGAVPVEVTESAPSRIIDVAKRSLRAIDGLFHAAVDIIDDGTTPWVIEINSNPGLVSHMNPHLGIPQPIPDLLVLPHFKG